MPLLLKKPAAVAAKPAAAAKAVAAKAPAKGPAKAAAAPAAEKPKKQAPPKAPGSATDEEISAAVAGTLAPRDTKGDKKQDFSARNANDRPAGRPLGVETGLPIMMCWCLAFQENEKNKPSEKLTDPQISDWMKSEFPGRETAAFDNVQYCRRLYNTGRFTKGAIPKVQSHRYDENGAVIDPGTKTAQRAEAKAAKEAAGNAAATTANAKKAGALLKKNVVKA